MSKASSKGPTKRGRPPGKVGEGSSNRDDNPDDEGSSGSEAEKLRRRILEAEGRRLSEAEAGPSGTQDADGEGDDEMDDGDDEGDDAETEAARKKTEAAKKKAEAAAKKTADKEAEEARKAKKVAEAAKEKAAKEKRVKDREKAREKE